MSPARLSSFGLWRPLRGAGVEDIGGVGEALGVEGHGVGVEVGEKEAAIDLEIVVEYGVSIAELGRNIQRNVKQSVERMTGLHVVEVNIAVDDVYLPADGGQDSPPSSRVS